MTKFQVGGTKPPFRANLLSGTLKVVMSEPPFRDQPYLNFILLNFIFSLGRLSSDELSFNLDVFLGRRGPPYQNERSLFLFIIVLMCVFIDFWWLLVPLWGPVLMSFYIFCITFSNTNFVSFLSSTSGWILVSFLIFV